MLWKLWNEEEAVRPGKTSHVQRNTLKNQLFKLFRTNFALHLQKQKDPSGSSSTTRRVEELELHLALQMKYIN